MNLDIVNLNVPTQEDFKRKKWRKYFRNVVQHTNADLYILPEGLSDPVADYRIQHGLTENGPALLYNVNKIQVIPNNNYQCNFVEILGDFSIFTGLSVVSTLNSGRISRRFDLASWGPTLFADAFDLFAYKAARELHRCIAITENPVISVGPMPVNNSKINKAVENACQERCQQYFDRIEQDLCDTSFRSTERVMKPFRDLNKFNVIGCNNDTNSSIGVIASRSLKIEPPSPLRLDFMEGLNLRGCPIHDFRPTTTSVMMNSHPPPMPGA
ncbi:hypothetical protein DPMN_034041 [Dreissena polymorpha]|uniref:Uncharacterized protein n=1 Tax=Dreissena polymorpha TaxID=45954 RepID=A0A9D4M6V5_DREPO|nr:hypothetical protein DPMN_034041 [Dreissena polymorpha]